MILADDTKDALARQVLRLFEDILATLPAECGSIDVKRNKKDDSHVDVSLVPANATSAEFGATILGGAVYSADFGRTPTFTTFEFPWEVGLLRKAGFDLQLEVLKKMCLAVIAGNCEHRHGRFGTQGVIFVSESKVYRVTNYPLSVLFRPRRDLRVTQYAPYYEGATTHSRSFPQLSL